MARAPDLRAKSQTFADTIHKLLNGTICNGAVVAAALWKTREEAFVGTGKRDRAAPFKSTPVPVRIRAKSAPSCWLDLGFGAHFSRHGHFTVVASYFSFTADEAMAERLFHYDYERNKEDDYPEAHLQVYGENDHLRSLCKAGDRRRTATENLHFPVGGRRYRPSLEDVIEFLIVEKLVESRTAWRSALEPTREKFHRIQLRAAIDRDKETAAKELEELGYRVTPPNAT